MKQRKYNQLHDIMSNLGDKNVNVIMGDFNVKIGSDNQGYENVMGVHGLGVMNVGSVLLTHVLFDWRKCIPSQENTQGTWVLSLKIR